MRALALCLALAACGGSDSPLSTAHAQAVAQIEIARLHFILRPADNGQWYIQNDTDHASIGVLTDVVQTATDITVTFDRRYTHAGVIQITSDDDFRGAVTGNGNLGVTGTRIAVTAGGQKIDPATVWRYVPRGSGNLWVSVTMLNKP